MAGANGMYPPDGASSGDARGVPPFVRERLRRRRGVPAAVLGPDLHWPGRGQLSGELAETAFAVAVAVVAHNVRDATLALAWGTPLVCDAVTALRLGIEDGVHALVDGDPQAIWTDSALAASLSRNGRRKWETEHDAVRAAAELAVRLLPAAENSLIRHAASLGTPPTAAIFDRVADFGLG